MRTAALATRSAFTSSTFGAYPRVVAPPSGFGWSPSWKVIETAPGVFTTTLDPLSLRVSTAQPRYVDAAAANNAATGLSPAAPKQGIWSAIGVGGNDTIYIKGSADPSNPTIYDDNRTWLSNPVQSCNFIVVSDFTTLAPGYAVASTCMLTSGGSGRLGTYALTADVAGPHVYEATLASANTPIAVLDATALAASGAPSGLTSRASIALVEANPGSYYHDTAGGKFYVRTTDSRAPDAKLRVCRSVINGYVNSAVDLYVERLTFEGGNQRAFYAQRVNTAAFVDCNFWWSSRQGLELNASTASATHTVYAIRCKALSNAGDGLGATTSGADAIVRWCEIDCESTGNSGAGTDQGSSLHLTAGNTSVSAIRINGTFASNKTDGFADVGGTTTWALGCRFTGEAIGAYVGDTGTGWLHGCTFSGCTTDIDPFDAGATINVDGSTIYNTSAGSGTVAKYSP